MSGWQPIETAPKDGTRVLVVEWIEQSRGVKVAVVSIGMCSHGDSWHDDSFDYLGTVTHWMLLPSPPNSESR